MLNFLTKIFKIHKDSNVNIRANILMPLGLAFALLLAVSVFSLYWLQEQQIDKKTNFTIQKINEAFFKEQRQDAKLLIAAIDFLKEDKNLQNAWLAGDRDLLLKYAQPLFDNLKSKYKVSQFNFHLPDKTCFLRVHQPDKYGDETTQYTMQSAYLSHKPAYGIELGTSGTFTLRVVHPWIINDKLAGFIELGEELDHITRKLHGVIKSELFIAIDKSYLNHTEWKKYVESAKKTPNWNLFSDYVIVDSTMRKIPQELRCYIETHFAKDKGSRSAQQLYDWENNISITLSGENRDKYQGGFIPLVDAGGNTVGDIIAIVNISTEYAFLKKLLLILISTGLIVYVAIIGAFYFYIGTIEEKLKTAQRQIKEAAEMKTKFVSTASHELRTPLTSIKEGINLVHSEITGPLNDDQKEFLGIAKRNVDRLSNLINDVLDFQKISAGKMTLRLRPAGINETVLSVEETMRPLAKEKKIELILELDQTVPVLSFDKDKIIQVLTNLVNNALKFTETGSIKIVTSLNSDNIITSVKDTGCGIRQEDIPRLFKEFEQLTNANGERTTGGTGLGLAICKKIIENHNGRIWAESDYGKGTTFYFELPLEKKLCQTKS